MGLGVSGQIDTIRKDSIQINKAPEALEKLINNITTSKKKNNEIDLEVDGLLFDETRTKSGRDFYDLFYNKWTAPPNSKNYSIFIQEKPFRMSTTLVEIKINETMVYQAVIQPRYDYLETISDQAIKRVGNVLAHYDEIMKQLDGDDKSGSGIF